MKFSLSFLSIITVCILPKMFSHGSRKVPGNISCGYFSALEETCGEPTVPATDLPKEATSIFYSGIGVDATLNVEFGYDDRSNDEHMKRMLSTGKSVFLLYYHRGDDQLMAKISSNSQDGGVNAKTEMSNLKTFLEPYNNITGLSVYGLGSSANYTTTHSLTENFKIYIDEMRSCFPDKGIGLSIDGNSFCDMFDESNSPVWFDLSVLDSSLDFYLVEMYALDFCIKEFNDVSSQTNGSTPNTMNKVIGYLNQLCVPKEKIYFIFAAAYASAVDENQSTCDVTNAKICTTPIPRYCPETTQLFYDKGAFTKKNGAGFVVWDVDLDDDPHGCCQCCTPYPAFHSIMAGFNGDPVPPVCPLLEE